MITSPSFYRTIHKQQENNLTTTRRRLLTVMHRHTVKIVVSIALFVLLFTSFLLIGTYASSNEISAVSMGEQVVTVNAGDTLWGIAKRFNNENEDTRYIIYLIKDRNKLQNADIKPGQKLIIPN